ncbi:S8 family serine peptidase [Thalassomonas viridans]|uniref:S8 family serine peptidase n=1 Tax=Thalassomonas viridans TaxID=137584 RepID=A0AAE9Z8C4_9GAMM|nr:S8 family serine peptidase [Thalassomonas viridans]WDE07894.1 S8 family serine peptidase [Thalassomonas viridans]
MSTMKVKRGNQDISLKKIDDQFAVRLKQGAATSEQELNAVLRQPNIHSCHISAVEPARMDVFSLSDSKDLDRTMDSLRHARESEVISHVYSLDDDQSTPVVPTGKLTVQFKAGVTSQTQEKILGDYGLELVQELDYLPRSYSVSLTQASTMNPLKICVALEALDEIEAAEADLAFEVALKHRPADSLYSQQWHLNNNGGPSLRRGADVKAEAAWEFTRGSRDISICVMDDGFDLNHPDLSGAGKIVSPKDFGDNDFSPRPVNRDDNHGTACAGVAVAEENGSGVVGLAPLCALMPVRTSGWLSDDSIEALFQHAIDHHADVISCSWSAASWNFPLSIRMKGIIHKAATEGRRNKKGCVILFAAGNENRPLDGIEGGRISHQGFALHPDVMAVAASNSLDRKSGYSNFGPALSVCAPSSGSPGKGIVTTDRLGQKGYRAGDFTTSFGGTSSSTPLAAGLAGLILAYNGELTAAEVKDIIQKTADKIDDRPGEYDADGHSRKYGFGRINAERALALLAAKDEQSLPRTLFMEHRVSKPIPDQGSIDEEITFPVAANIAGFEVSVDISHTYRGDLTLILKSPSGTEIVLHQDTGGNAQDLVKSYRMSDEPDLLGGLAGSAAQGQWQLTVRDELARDVGVLNKWGIAVTY